MRKLPGAPGRHDRRPGTRWVSAWKSGRPSQARPHLGGGGLMARFFKPAQPTTGALRRESSGRSLLRALGRLVLWAFLILALVRGIGAMLERPESAPSPQPRRPRVRHSAARAEAFAADFARAYLSFDPRRSRGLQRGARALPRRGRRPRRALRAARVRRSSARDSGAPRRPQRNRRSAEPDHCRGSRRVGEGEGRTVYLSVPVANLGGGPSRSRSMTCPRSPGFAPRARKR